MSAFLHPAVWAAESPKQAMPNFMFLILSSQRSLNTFLLSSVKTQFFDTAPAQKYYQQALLVDAYVVGTELIPSPWLDEVASHTVKFWGYAFTLIENRHTLHKASGVNVGRSKHEYCILHQSKSQELLASGFRFVLCTANAHICLGVDAVIVGVGIVLTAACTQDLCWSLLDDRDSLLNSQAKVSHYRRHQ